MMKLLCQIFGCPNRRDELINQVRRIEEAMKEDASRLADRTIQLNELKIDLGLPTGNQRSLVVEVTAWGISALILILVCMTAILIGTVDARGVADFLAYAFPTLAAVLGGLGLVLRHDRRFYALACASVVAGLISYTKSKYQIGLFNYLELVTVYALVMLLAAILISIAHYKSEKSKIFNVLKLSVYILVLIATGVTFYYVVADKKRLIQLQVEVVNVTCDTTETNNGGRIHVDPKRLTLVCKTVSETQNNVGKN